MADTPLYGLMAEFTSTDALVSAAERVHREGYTRIDALTPMPVHGLAEAMGYDDRRIQKMILAGGLFGCHRRSRPAAPRQPARHEPQHRRRLPDRLSAEHRRPAAGQPAVVHRPGVRDDDPVRGADRRASARWRCAACRMPYHPVFNVKRFRERGSTDGLFLCVEAEDPKFDAARDARAAPGPRGERGV